MKAPAAITVIPTQLVLQSQGYAEYTLAATLWGSWWEQPLTVVSIRPKAIPPSSLYVRLLLGPDEPPSEQTRIAVWGGVDGARYEIRFGDELAFQVKKIVVVEPEKDGQK